MVLAFFRSWVSSPSSPWVIPLPTPLWFDCINSHVDVISWCVSAYRAVSLLHLLKDCCSAVMEWALAFLQERLYYLSLSSSFFYPFLLSP